VDGNNETRSDTISVFNGPAPTIETFDTPQSEIEAVATWLKERLDNGLHPEEIGIFVRSEAQFPRAKAALQAAEIAYKALDQKMDTAVGCASLCTMHMAKGLEFRAVAVMACDDEIIPLQERIETVTDTPDLEEVYNTERHLLYVACTRAKKKLKWVSLDYPEGSFSSPKSSWVHGLMHWLSGNGTIPVEAKKVEDFDLKSILSSGSGPALPMYFYDPVGIFEKDKAMSALTIAAELSVTRLNSLVDCPRKFYFQNTLKLSAPQEERFFSRSESDDEISVSSADRGTEIHAFISEALGRNFTVPRAGMKHTEAIGYALDELRELREEYDFVSEVPLKFRFFNFMISGTPDLYLLPRKKDQIAQVWDFKTGKISENALAHYWLQLKTYAYALYALGLVERSLSIKTKLCFVDQKKILELEVRWEEIERELFTLWDSQNEPWKINSDHCAQCSYGDICPR